MSKENLHLPKTAFSMKANLPTKEPEILEYWKKINKNPQKKQIDYVDWIELIKFKETRNYVQRVLENYNVYRYILEQKPIKLKDFFKNDPLY